MRLSRDHNGDLPSEEKRVGQFEQRGEFKLDYFDTPEGEPQGEIRLFRIEKDGCLYGGLRPTRGFGNWVFQPAFTHVPEVRESVFHKRPRTLFALCTDGACQAVEQTMRHYRWRTHNSAIDDIADDTFGRLVNLSDDATVVYFRVL
jgi:hypothetical protein